MTQITMKTKAEHITAYFASGEHLDKALGEMQSEYHTTPFIQMAHTVYDHNTRRFTKRREGDLELANALLIVQRRQGTIPHDLQELVDEHA